MTQPQSSACFKLFYSYSHEDADHRMVMAKHLNLLKRQGSLREWYDHEILPGRQISPAIRKEMDQTQIFAFLFTSNFIASDACMAEWEYAKSLAEHDPAVFRIP